MRLLLDTHALLWWLLGDRRLSTMARQAIAGEDNEVFVSAVSAWEITTKYRIGRLPEAGVVAADVAGAVSSQGFAALQVTMRDGQIAGGLPAIHKDPFDRMLIAQAQAERLTLVSNERLFDRYGVARLW